MGMPLWRAWEVCRVLDHDDLARDWDNEIARALVLSDDEVRPAISRPVARAPKHRDLPPVQRPLAAPRLLAAAAAPPPPPPPAPAPRPAPPLPAVAPGKQRTLADRDPAAAARAAARRRQRLNRGA